MAYIFEQVLGAAMMRNSLALVILLAWLLAHDRRWHYVAEGAVLLAVQAAVAGLTARDAPKTVAQAAFVLALYPVSVAAALFLRPLLTSGVLS